MERNEPVDSEINHFLMIPYLGKISIKYRRKLKRLLNKLDVNVNVVFHTTKVGNYFNLKDITPKLLRSCLVYRFTCRVDPDTQYLGETKRRLHQRINEHIKGNSAVSQHLSNCNSCSDSIRECFQIEYKGKSNLEIRVVEALKINQKIPSLNRMWW